MAVSSSSIAASFCYKPCSTPKPSRLSGFSPIARIKLRASPRKCSSRARPALTPTSKLYSSKPFGSDASVSPEDPGEKQYSFPSPRSGRAVPVFVTLPPDSINLAGKMARKKVMGASLQALKTAGVEGVVVEVWWGIVERDGPRVYDWSGYLEIVSMAGQCGLKVRAIMAFHQCGVKPDDSCWIPLPQWVQEEMQMQLDLAYSDRFGRRNREYISLACDTLPVLRGRSPIQAYSDFMRNFRDTFREFLGIIITDIQVGMGPAGELRYPSCPTEKLTWSSREIGEFQCYDKYMIASLNACARDVGRVDWGNGGPFDAGNLMQNPEKTGFFKSDGSWNTPYGQFFLEWYSGMLVLHGERLAMVSKSIFCGTGVKLFAKVAGIYWHYSIKSHPAELTAGYYNTSIRDGYLPIARMFGRHGMTLCCTCFDLQDVEQKLFNESSSPEGFLRQLVFAASMCNVPVVGENSVTRLDDLSLKQVIKSSKLYLDDGDNGPCFSFNFVRMSKELFNGNNWIRFARFVRQMSDSKTFRARLNSGGSESRFSPTSAAEEFRLAFAITKKPKFLVGVPST